MPSALSDPPALRLPGSACRLRRLSEHGRPLAGGVTRGAFLERVGEAGIGERLRSDEVPPRNDETFAGPADGSLNRHETNWAFRVLS